MDKLSIEKINNKKGFTSCIVCKCVSSRPTNYIDEYRLGDLYEINLSGHELTLCRDCLLKMRDMINDIVTE